MGQKTHPYGFRLGVIKTWNSKWFEDKAYAKWLHEDLKLRNAIRKKFANAGIAGIQIERAANKAKVVIATSRPGIIIGRRGAGVEQLKAELAGFTDNELFIDIQEVRKAETNAQLVAENIATQLERRVAFRRAMKKAVTIAMKFTSILKRLKKRRTIWLCNSRAMMSPAAKKTATARPRSLRTPTRVGAAATPPGRRR